MCSSMWKIVYKLNMSEVMMQHTPYTLFAPTHHFKINFWFPVLFNSIYSHPIFLWEQGILIYCSLQCLLHLNDPHCKSIVRLFDTLTFVNTEENTKGLTQAKTSGYIYSIRSHQKHTMHRWSLTYNYIPEWNLYILNLHGLQTIP